MKNKYIIKESYLLIVIIVGILSLCMYSSFALFSLEKTTSKDIVTMKAASNIETTLKIYEYKKVTVPAGSNTSVMVNVNNDTGGSIYYGVFYEMVSPSTKTDDIGIYKIDWSENATSGSITNGSILPVELLVINNTSSDITLNIGVAGSDSNELGLTDGKTLITETFNTGNEPSGDAGETKTTTTDYSYTGSVQTVTLKAGTHKLEVWGAEGGYRNSATYAGKGGYSYGTLTLTETTNAYVYVGGSGNSGTCTSSICNGGFNGGGYRHTHKGGGGASDIRLGTDSLYARVIVAGGGGSDGSTSKKGMYGGGTSGGSSSESFTANSNYCGKGGTQTYSGYSTSYTITTQTTSGLNSNTTANYAGGFGFGGGGVYLSSGYGGAGGGGWYGGSGTVPDGSGDDDRGGGGGSGYVYTSSTASSYPSGCLLNSSYYLTDASTIAGDQSFTDNSGSTVTGHSGDGHIRITSTVKASTVPSIDTSAISIEKGQVIDLSTQVTCKDNGAGCKIVLVQPATTKGLTKSTTALYVLEDNNGNRYKYKKQVNIAQNFAKLIMSQSKGDSWDANAEDGVYYTNSHEYRYIGAEPNNYVWFNNDMYQAIGVFDSNSHGVSGQNLVKLIMANPLGGYYWGAYNSSNTSGTLSAYKNDWTGNTTGVKANLNVLLNEYFANRTNTSSTYGSCANWTYFNSDTNYRTNDCSDIVGYGLTSSALNSIETTTWYLYGSSTSQSKQNWYLCERGGNSCTSANSGSYSTTTSSKIGLMYLSDYLYASSYYSSSDTTTSDANYYGNKNWLYKGSEWTQTPNASSAYSVMSVINGRTLFETTGAPVGWRPTFYLKFTVSVTGGDGTFDNPYVVE